MTETAKAPLLQELPFNISETIKVRLTDRGRQIYVRNNRDLTYTDDEILQQLDASKDANGFNHFQLYMLMAIFGKFLPKFPTFDESFLFFENNEIILVPNPLDVRIAELST